MGQIDFDRLVYFGDSLTDSDEFFNASAAVAFFGIPPTEAGYDGQFSNGPVYSDFVPDLLGVEGGDEFNFAVGGAQTLTDNTVGDALAGSGLIRPDATAEDLAFRMDIDGQVDRFLASDLAGGDLSDTAASFLIGLNDFNDFVPMDLENVVNEAIAFGVAIATNTITAAAQLSAAGVGTIIINELPGLEVFPTFESITPDLQALGAVVSAAQDDAIRQGAAQLEALGSEVIFVEWGTMLEEINADFASFGFQEFDETLVLGSNGADGPNPAVADIPEDQVGWIDSVHPTTDVHGILAAFQAESLLSNTLIGDGEANALRGARGADLILGRDGDDSVGLARGRDVAIAGLGDDSVNGGRGGDLIAGGDGADLLIGGRGRDIIADGLGNDLARGGRGADLMIDGAGDDVSSGGRGSDFFVFTEASLLGAEADASNTFFGGRGDDTLILRVADASADLGRVDNAGSVEFTALGVT
ncbi:MAG: SGNH/GDSL hydrolase family protein, partial [Pseudomonadota bacterium]